MIKLLAKIFIKDRENVKDKTVREKYCVLGGAVGAVCNLFLFGLKLTIGTLMKSIAITSDAFNNLSDMGSCFVAIIGAKLSNRLPDREHPFGHGRIEYISSLIVSFIILIVGFELFKGSVDKILNPEPVIFSIPMIIILAASLLVKLWMFVCYRFIAEKIDSSVMKATARDSINDVISTGAVIAATVAGHFLPFHTDGFVGVIVAVYIMYGGIKLAKETIDLLLGTPPTQETIETLSGIILSREEIVGIHDLIVHDYGPGRVFASVHAEVPDDANAVHIHEIIDAVERQILLETGIQMVIHSDPITVNNEYVDGIKENVKKCIENVAAGCTMHDFRITDGENRINLIFDLVISSSYPPKESAKIVSGLKEALHECDSRYEAVITVDRDYNGR
ncbi:MAG: cation transporter [Oscillospiraceae bacterium]|nr:cation transporter [Oscillospiraceae bacterium]